MLAIGQKAAYFTGTRHFVNIVECGGMYGFDGICRLCARIEEAFLTARDPRNYIQQKGLGCDSCLLNRRKPFFLPIPPMSPASARRFLSSAA